MVSWCFIINNVIYKAVTHISLHYDVCQYGSTTNKYTQNIFTLNLLVMQLENTVIVDYSLKYSISYFDPARREKPD